MALIELDLKPEPRKLRTFGLIGFIALGGLALWARWQGSLLGFSLEEETARGVSLGLGGAAIALGALALAFPPALRAVYIGMTLVTFPIGLVISHVILFTLYFGVIMPIGLVMRALGHDPLTRKIDKSAESYWVPRRRVDDVERYFRQY